MHTALFKDSFFGIAVQRLLLAVIIFCIYNPSVAIADNIITAPAITTFCGTGDATTITGNVPTNCTGTIIAYQWQSSTDNITFANITGFTSTDYDPPLLSATTYYRRLITSGTCGTSLISNTVTITINTTPIATVSAGSTICFGDALVLRASGGTTYQWSPAAGLSATNVAAPFASPSTTTTYTVTVANGTCTSTATVTITVIPQPKVNAGADKEIVNGDKVQLAGQVTGTGAQYSWSPTTYLDNPNILTPVATPTADITYTLTATTPQSCFVVSDALSIKVYGKIVIPNAFTPNGDGINDTWAIVSLNTYNNSVLKVFTRNGMQLYTSTGYVKPWDGTFEGKLVPFGTYYYTIDLKNGSKPISGWVAIVK